MPTDVQEVVGDAIKTALKRIFITFLIESPQLQRPPMRWIQLKKISREKVESHQRNTIVCSNKLSEGTVFAIRIHMPTGERKQII